MLWVFLKNINVRFHLSQVELSFTLKLVELVIPVSIHIRQSFFGGQDQDEIMNI